jgi:hypothetical protein
VNRLWAALGVATLVLAGCGGGSAATMAPEDTASNPATTAPEHTPAKPETPAPADIPSYLEVMKEAAEAKAEGKLPQNLEPGESAGAEEPAGGDCLAFVEGFSSEQIETLLDLAQREVEAGGTEPAPGTCGAERLEWMREQVE